MWLKRCTHKFLYIKGVSCIFHPVRVEVGIIHAWAFEITLHVSLATLLWVVNSYADVNSVQEFQVQVSRRLHLFAARGAGRRWQPWHSSVHCRNYTPQCHYRFAYDRNALNGRGEGRGRAGRAPAAAQSVRAGPRAAPLTPRSPPSNSPVQCKCLWFYGVHITTTVVVGCDRGGGRRCVLVVLFSAHVLAREMFTRPTHALCLLACRSTA